MDLSKPPNEYLEEIDRELQKLEEETRVIKEKFGFEGIEQPTTSVPIKIKKKAATQPKKFKYDSLAEVVPDTDTPVPIIVRPEISADWVTANKLEPDLKVFYDKSRFEKQVFRSEDFVLTKESNAGLESLDVYMSQFALMH